MSDLWSDIGRKRSKAVAEEVPTCDTCPAWSRGLCGKASLEAQLRLAGLAHPQTVPAGTLIAEEGGLAADVFTLRSGCVRLFNLMPDGRRHIMGFLFAGDFIGLGLGDHFVFSAQAIGEVSFCRFHRGSFDRIVGENPHLASVLSDRVLEDLNQTRAQLLVLGRKTAEERMASLLLWLSDKNGVAKANGLVIGLPMSRSDIADYLGITTETVSRIFTRFRARKILTSQGNSQVTVLDKSALKALSAGLVSPSAVCTAD